MEGYRREKKGRFASHRRRRNFNSRESSTRSLNKDACRDIPYDSGNKFFSEPVATINQSAPPSQRYVPTGVTEFRATEFTARVY